MASQVLPAMAPCQTTLPSAATALEAVTPSVQQARDRRAGPGAVHPDSAGTGERRSIIRPQPQDPGGLRWGVAVP